MTTIVVDDQQHATLIAALNFYHDQGQGDPAYRTDWIHHLATNGDQVISLDAGGINRLIEQINYCGSEWFEAFKKEFDEKLAGMTDEELIKSFEEIGCAIVVRHSEDDEDDSKCRSCGGPNDDGEGYDGLCGDCADKASCHECGADLGDPVEDIDERLCPKCKEVVDA